MEEKTDYLKQLKEYLPLIYIFLVCFGYFNKSIFYYDKFQIDILNYLSTQELILMFIPIGSSIIFMLVLTIGAIAPIAIFAADITKEEDKEEKQTKKTKKKKGVFFKTLFFIREFLSFLLVLYLSTIYPILFVYYAAVDVMELPKLENNTIILLMATWACVFFIKLVLFAKKEKKKRTFLLSI